MITPMFIFTSILILVGMIYVVPMLFFLSFAALGSEKTFGIGLFGIVLFGGAEIFLFWLVANRILFLVGLI